MEWIFLFFKAFSIVNISWFLVLQVISFWIFLNFFVKKERRLIKNIRRKIMIYAPNDQDITAAYNLLKDSNFFNLVERTDAKVMDTMAKEKPGLVIIGFSPEDRNNFYTIFHKAKYQELPIVIYTFGKNNSLESSDWEQLQGYSFYSIVNSPLRLLNDVFAILSVYPEKK